MNQLLDKLRIRPIKDRSELESVVLDTASLQLQLADLVNRRNQAVSELSSSYDLAAERLQADIAARVTRLQTYCTAQRQALFGDRQSLAVAGHKLAWRRSPGKVDFADGVKTDDALNSLLTLDDDDAIERFITIKPTLDKKAILKAWDSSEASRALLSSIGILVVHPESFAFEPDLEAVPTSALKSPQVPA